MVLVIFHGEFSMFTYGRVALSHKLHPIYGKIAVYREKNGRKMQFARYSDGTVHMIARDTIFDRATTTRAQNEADALLPKKEAQPAARSEPHYAWQDRADIMG